MALVAIDGPTGVGKTTTARAVAEALDAPLVLDPVSVSPLLDDYYTGEASPAAALDAELAFLHSRAELLASAPTDRVVVSDFSVMRTAPFAEFLDDPDDRRRVLHDMRDALARTPRPDVLVLLSAEPPTLLERVRRRDRTAEGELTLSHLDALTHHFDRWRIEMLDQSDHVFELDTSRWDPQRVDDLDELLERIGTALATSR